MRRIVLGFLSAWLLADVARAEAPGRPNIVFIIADDLRWDELGCTGHPFVKTPNIDRLAREGARFPNAFATTPLCSPSRASFLTGQYPHKHGITDNTDRSPRTHQLPTFLRLLKLAGYTTAFIGKWHMGVDDSPRPGIDHWVGFRGQGQYHDPEVNVDGRGRKLAGYATDRLNDFAVDFVRRDHGRPFVLYLSHKAVHPNLEQRPDGSISDPTASQFIPAERHKHLYADEKVPRRPNARFDRLQGKPALMRPIEGLPPLSPATGTSDAVVRDRLRMLMSVEEGVGRLYEALREKGVLDRTVFVFTSDHGYFYGEHGLSVERRLAYEEAIRIPLLVRYPPLVRAGSTPGAMALSLDVAPTLLELAGAPPPKDVHGRSLVPVLNGKATKLRDAFLVEYFSDTVFPRVHKMGYQAVRTHRHTYVRYTELEGMDELYDLEADPYQMRNLVAEPDVQPALVRLRRELDRLLTETR